MFFQVAVVVGGRNFFCGDTWMTTIGIDRSSTFQIGYASFSEKACSTFSFFNRTAVANTFEWEAIEIKIFCNYKGVDFYCLLSA